MFVFYDSLVEKLTAEWWLFLKVVSPSLYYFQAPANVIDLDFIIVKGIVLSNVSQYVFSLVAKNSPQEKWF